MEKEAFHIQTTLTSYALILRWAKENNFQPVTENEQIKSLFATLIGHSITSFCDYSDEIYEASESIEFVFNLIRFDMYITHVLQCQRELNAFAAKNLDFQASALINDQIIPMLTSPELAVHDDLNEMGVLKIWNTLKSFALNHNSMYLIVILLDSDVFVTLMQLMNQVDQLILDENTDYLDAFETHI